MAEHSVPVATAVAASSRRYNYPILELTHIQPAAYALGSEPPEVDAVAAVDMTNAALRFRPETRAEFEERASRGKCCICFGFLCLITFAFTTAFTVVGPMQFKDSLEAAKLSDFEEIACTVTEIDLDSSNWNSQLSRWFDDGPHCFFTYEVM